MTSERLIEDNPKLVWLAAIIVAAIGSWIMFDALPGANWGIWTAAASVGLIIVARDRGTLDSSTLLIVATATVLAVGAAITADPFMHALICLAVMVFLSLAMLFAVNPGLQRLSALFVISAPFVAGGTALAESFARLVDLSGMFRSTRARATVRGIVITVPVVAFFALLLSNADPVFAGWRNELARIIETWSFIPRTIFFCALLTVVLGAYSFAARKAAAIAATPSVPRADAGSRRWLGATERLILLSAVTGLFWLFIAVQLSYLFGNVPAMPGSDLTFAEYAQKGFGELTVVATCSIILILVSERYGRVDGHGTLVRGLTIALLLAVLIILFSAFNRVVLYEAAYGFTVSRLYAQVYMIVLGFALLALAVEVLTTLDTRALFRRVFAVAVIAFLVLVFWNHEGWIASKNIDRFANTGKLDVRYLVIDMSPNAIPVIVSRLSALPDPKRAELRDAIVTRYRNPRRLGLDRWFEWNYRREQARQALARMGLPEPTAKPVVVRSRLGFAVLAILVPQRRHCYHPLSEIVLAHPLVRRMSVLAR